MGRTRERAWRNSYEPKKVLETKMWRSSDGPKKKVLEAKMWRSSDEPKKKVLEAKMKQKQAQKLSCDDGVDVIVLSESEQEQCESAETVSSMSDSSLDDNSDKQEESELVENVSPVSDSRRSEMPNQIKIGIQEVVHNDTQGVKKITDYTSSSKGKRKEHIPEWSNDDFQTPEKRKKLDEHTPEKPITLQVQPFVLFTNRRLEPVIPPSKLGYALAGLSDAQNAAIKSMGFESMKYMNIPTIPASLGYWLLINYNHTDNTLNVGTHKIEITPTIVRDILGVPMGANNVKEGVKTVNYRSVYLADWERQFGSDLTEISLAQVIEQMKLQENGGRLFKQNFLVVFNTIMCETTNDSAINTRFLTSIKKRTDIANMDWCSYIITCLKRTKEEWTGVGTYNGPLTFLVVLYAHDQLLRHTPAKAKTPAIQYVTTDFLLELESNLYKAGDVSKADANGTENNHTHSLLELESNLYKAGDVSKTHVDGTENDHTEASVVSKSLVHSGVKEKTSVGTKQTQQHEQMGKDSSRRSGIICVQGYKVKSDIAPTLEAIMKKHGDIAAKCLFKTDAVRLSFLEVVCEVVKLIKTGDVIDRMEEMESQLSDAKAANINVSWLQAQLEAIKKHTEASQKYSMLTEIKANTVSVKRAAQMELSERSAELVAAEKRFVNAEKCVRVLQLVEKHISDNIREHEAAIESCVKQPVV